MSLRSLVFALLKRFRSSGKITGTDAYLALKVIRCKEYDHEDDIYSFGIMLWEMWYGKKVLFEEEEHASDQEAKGAKPS